MSDSSPKNEPWIISDQDRYDRLRLISWWDQEKLASARIMVVGAGALGNEVLKNLVLLGIGHIYLVDFDKIEVSNLSRSVFFRDSDAGSFKAEVAAGRASELNPECQIHVLCDNVMTEVGLGLIQSCDVVLGCLDNREARLWVNRMCWKACTPWIDGGIQEINGVAKVYQPPNGSCYECTMTANDYRLINLRYSCPLLKQEDIQAGRVPTAPTIASMFGALQVQEVLKLLHDVPTDTGTALVYNGMANQFYKSKLPRNDDCLSHETYQDIVSAQLSNKDTIESLFRFAKSTQTDANESSESKESWTLTLDRDLLKSLDCTSCGTSKKVSRPAMAVNKKEGVCNQCGQDCLPQMTSEVSHDWVAEESLQTTTLQQLGIPAWDILKLENDRGAVVCVRLDADQETYDR